MKDFLTANLAQHQLFSSVNGEPSPPLKCDPSPGWHDPKVPLIQWRRTNRFEELDASCMKI